MLQRNLETGTGENTFKIWDEGMEEASGESSLGFKPKENAERSERRPVCLGQNKERAIQEWE